ncbi:sugar O-acetyltransferase [Lacinutrix sp. MEBiC02595]
MSNPIKTEKQKMLSGKLYNALDIELSQERLKARLLIKELNDLKEDEKEKRGEILKDLIPNQEKNLWIQTPFYCDYGYNLIVGEGVFFNYNCIALDVMPIKIGPRSLMGPNVQLYTATHPMDFKERASGLEFAKPITIGEDVWLGGGVIVCPGVTIGDRTVIGAGSVVTKDMPSDVFAAGNPCRIINSKN